MPRKLQEFCRNGHLFSETRYTGPSGHQTRCSACAKVTRAKWKSSDPDRINSAARASKRKSRMVTHYKITAEEYDVLVLNQKNKCAICFEDFTKTPNIDHCHLTGNVRGLLCKDCNTGLGMFKDSIENTQTATNYLKGANQNGKN